MRVLFFFALLPACSPEALPETPVSPPGLATPLPTLFPGGADTSMPAPAFDLAETDACLASSYPTHAIDIVAEVYQEGDVVYFEHTRAYQPNAAAQAEGFGRCTATQIGFADLEETSAGRYRLDVELFLVDEDTDCPAAVASSYGHETYDLITSPTGEIEWRENGSHLADGFFTRTEANYINQICRDVPWG